jgi:hypothetical protein
MPRVWTVHEVNGLASEDDISSVFGRPGLDFARETFVVGDPPPVEKCTGDTVRLLARGSHHVEIEADMQCAGMVLLSESVFPGWTVRVDGVETEIHEAFGAIRGVVVERGVHQIEYRYEPWWFYLGVTTTILAAFSLAVMLWFNRKTRGGGDRPV